MYDPTSSSLSTERRRDSRTPCKGVRKVDYDTLRNSGTGYLPVPSLETKVENDLLEVVLRTEKTRSHSTCVSPFLSLLKRREGKGVLKRGRDTDHTTSFLSKCVSTPGFRVSGRGLHHTHTTPYVFFTPVHLPSRSRPDTHTHTLVSSSHPTPSPTPHSRNVTTPKSGKRTNGSTEP